MFPTNSLQTILLGKSRRCQYRRNRLYTGKFIRHGGGEISNGGSPSTHPGRASLDETPPPAPPGRRSPRHGSQWSAAVRRPPWRAAARSGRPRASPPYRTGGPPPLPFFHAPRKRRNGALPWHSRRALGSRRAGSRPTSAGCPRFAVDSRPCGGSIRPRRDRTAYIMEEQGNSDDAKRVPCSIRRGGHRPCCGRGHEQPTERSPTRVRRGVATRQQTSRADPARAGGNRFTPTGAGAPHCRLHRLPTEATLPRRPGRSAPPDSTRRACDSRFQDRHPTSAPFAHDPTLQTRCGLQRAGWDDRTSA